jgi:hypothetical protein
MDHLDEALVFKSRVHSALQLKIQDELAVLKDTLKGVQVSANSETKSSAGDKYETGRAMAQLEIEKITGLVHEKEKSLSVVLALPLQAFQEVRPGSLVKTSQGHFYISVNGGEIITGKIPVRCISPASPLATALRGKKVGELFRLMQHSHRIESIV